MMMCTCMMEKFSFRHELGMCSWNFTEKKCQNARQSLQMCGGDFCNKRMSSNLFSESIYLYKICVYANDGYDYMNVFMRIFTRKRIQYLLYLYLLLEEILSVDAKGTKTKCRSVFSLQMHILLLRNVQKKKERKRKKPK